jgi:hypothetical protein
MNRGFQKMGVRNWRRNSQDRVEWRKIWKRLRSTKDCNAKGRRSRKRGGRRITTRRKAAFRQR